MRWILFAGRAKRSGETSVVPAGTGAEHGSLRHAWIRGVWRCCGLLVVRERERNQIAVLEQAAEKRVAAYRSLTVTVR